MNENILFWSGFCFGGAIVSCGFVVGVLTYLIVKSIKNHHKESD